MSFAFNSKIAKITSQKQIEIKQGSERNTERKKKNKTERERERFYILNEPFIKL